jgi:hypothetical protein
MPEVNAAAARREDSMGTFLYRAMGAAALNAGMYETLEADQRVTRQALLVVLLSSVAAGIGSIGWSGFDANTLIRFAAVALITWFAWALLILQIGGRYLAESGTRTNLGELLRTIGFAASPGVLQILGVMSAITIPVFIVSWIWMFAAMVIAVRQALDFRTTGRALLVCAVALSLPLALVIIGGWFFGPTAG